MKLIKLIALIILCFSLKAEDYILMDDEAETFLNEIVCKLKNALNFNEDINIYISSDQSLNASATQSGDIVVNAGAIIQCKDTKELIAILAHEVGHIEGLHIATYLANQKDFLKAGLVPTLIGVIASVWSHNASPMIAGLMGSGSLGSGMALSKLRQKESIADTKAIQAVSKLEWWPIFDGFVSIHEKLNSDAMIFNKYLSTHPLSRDRIAKFEKYTKLSKTTSQKTIDLLQTYEKRFQTIKHKIRALTSSYELSSSIYTNPKNENEKYAKAIILYKLNKYQESIKIIDELLQTNPNNAYYTEIKAMSLINQQRCQQAAEISWKILQKDRNTNIHRDLGIIYADAVLEGKIHSQVNQAIKLLKKILTKHNNDLSTLNLLGKLYDLCGKPAEAALYAAKSAMLYQDTKMAKSHAQKALKSQNPIIRRQADDILHHLQEREN